MTETTQRFISSNQSRKSKELLEKITGYIHDGLTAQEIGARLSNPWTKKPYTEQHVYFLIRKAKKFLT